MNNMEELVFAFPTMDFNTLEDLKIRKTTIYQITSDCTLINVFLVKMNHMLVIAVNDNIT